MHKVFSMPVSSVYPLYVAKAERKGRTREEVDEIILWLTGFSREVFQEHLERGSTFREFFEDASLNPKTALITGSVCGVKVQEIEDPLVQKIRFLDKLVDELAKGRPMEKILREQPGPR